MQQKLIQIPFIEFVDDNASTTEDKQGTEDTEEIDEEEGTDGVSSEGEKPSGNESIEVNKKFNLNFQGKKMFFLS